MNNYNYYEEEIIKILKDGGHPTTSNGMLTSCNSIDCENCDFYANCDKGLGEWLAKEHINTVGCNKRTDGAVEFCTWLVKHYGLKNWIFKVEKALLKYMEEQRNG